MAYSLDGGACFAINAVTGVITTTCAFDASLQTLYTLTAIATEVANTTRSSSAPVVVAITWVNDHSPVLNAVLYAATITECSGLPAGPTACLGALALWPQAIAATIRADPASVYAVLRYNLTGNAAFVINSTTGVITVVSPIDYEATPAINLTVTVFSLGSSALKASSPVYVTVLDANDHYPIFNFVGNVSIPETTGLGGLAAVVHAWDQDVGVNAAITYTMTGSSLFAIDRVSGMVTVAGSLKNVGGPFTLTVTATDGGTPALSNTTTLTVRLSLVNSYAPVISPLSYSATFMESTLQSPVATVATVTATDGDTSNNARITYTLLPVADGALFAVDASTGVVSVPVGFTPTKLTYSLAISAADNGMSCLN